MKKRIFSSTLLTVILFSGCGSSNKSESTEVLSGVCNHSGKQGEAQYVDIGENIYESGMIFGGNGTKMYLDFETMEKTVLCSRPNCDHNTSECTAKIIGDTPIIYGDHIYYFDVSDGVNETSDGDEFYIDSKLKKISLSASETETVSEFTDCEPREYDGCVIFDDTLYFCGDDMNPTKDPYGGITYANGGGTHYLCSIDLDSGKYINYGSIYDGDKQYEGAANSSTAKILGYYDSRLFIQYSFMKEKDGIEKIESGIDARDVFTVLNFEFDTATKTLKESELPPPSYMDDDTYVYSNYPENSSVVIDKGKTYNIDGVDVDLIGRSFNGKLFMYDCWYDITDGSKHSLGEYENWEILTVYDDCYIMISDNRSKFVKLTEDELLALDD